MSVYPSKNFNVADIVKFVPYYASYGMQGASLRLKTPDYDGLALVLKVSKSYITLLLPTGNTISSKRACIEVVFSLTEDLSSLNNNNCGN
jgi:hypothetical protein